MPSLALDRTSRAAYSESAAPGYGFYAGLSFWAARRADATLDFRATYRPRRVVVPHRDVTDVGAACLAGSAAPRGTRSAAMRLVCATPPAEERR